MEQPLPDYPAEVSRTGKQRFAKLYIADEKRLTTKLSAAIGLNTGQRFKIGDNAVLWANKVRSMTRRSGVIDAFLQEYGLSTKEGIILMRLSEALIRTPDFATARQLMRDKLSAGDWTHHTGSSPATLINATTFGLRFSAAWVEATGGTRAKRLATKLGDRALHLAVVRGIGIMAAHFVLGSSIAEATAKVDSSSMGKSLYSFDMLGEAACTNADAEHYFSAYKKAIEHLSSLAGSNASVETAHGLSVKLSALHPRYEYNKRRSCVPALLYKVKALAVIAKRAGIGLTIDAEESHRLELSLQIFTALLHDPELDGWHGLGIVIQAYQRRATATIQFVVDAANAAQRKIAVRLVKGAYWDSEIKRAQEIGLESYPVFTRKENTDISYLACAAQLLAAGPTIFAQFATHNAHTAAAILEIAGEHRCFEFQRLHGMGEALHDEIRRDTGIMSRVYAPVGNHKELLPYLVRRLLENGANSSFVNQLMNSKIEIEDIVRDPIAIGEHNGFTANIAIPAPRALFDGVRLSAMGIDLTQSLSAQNAEQNLSALSDQPACSIINGVQLDRVKSADIEKAITASRLSDWQSGFTAQQRANCLKDAANLIESRMQLFMALCVNEAAKTLSDAVAEIREAVDFCRYYADQAIGLRMVERAPLGVVACISPWNFPLAIFMGQVTAALAAGNGVIAKPAEQTPLVAITVVKLLHEAGVPHDALHLVIGGGGVGEMLIGNTEIDAVCFTGSTSTAKTIAAKRADIGRADSVLIAETGGINAMIVDSTALLEQAVRDVVASAFQSAGQRCSACRLVCVQEDIAEDFERMLAGAIATLETGDQAALATDVGPIIDQAAHQKISDYIDVARKSFRVIGEAPQADPRANGHFIRPIAFAMDHINALKQEIFGPVLHMVRFSADQMSETVDAINALGYGLTLGIHSRIDGRIRAIAQQAKVGNIYVNRNQIGALVGVQPFGGEGLSGTGPKAGGPHYLLRLSRKNDIAAPLDRIKKTLLPYNPDPNLEIAAIISKSRFIQKNWASCDQLATVKALARAFCDIEFLTASAAESLLALQTPSLLPGPTGEENTLCLVPRGVLLCCGGNTPEILIRQVLIALATGNSALILSSPDTAAIEALAMQICGQMTDIKIPIAIVTRTDLAGCINADIDGIVADGGSRPMLAKALAIRQGAIIPCLSVHDDPERYFHERTLSIDTTAAGGNASLLAMQAEKADL
jgi:RHH-type transcriptional regulator, proline utilization regulon repressor / proline dehydrogenase / delta 1-pyrroline-5-carboxylate dehydrogenase